MLTYAVFALYAVVANWLNSLGLVFLPLGTIYIMPVMIIDLAVLSLYIIRRRERAQTNPSNR